MGVNIFYMSNWSKEITDVNGCKNILGAK